MNSLPYLAAAAILVLLALLLSLNAVAIALRARLRGEWSALVLSIAQRGEDRQRNGEVLP